MNDNDLYTWLQSPGSRTCADSNKLHNQTDTLRNWKGHILPGSPATICKGKCDCKLEPATVSEPSLSPYRVTSVPLSKPPRIVNNVFSANTKTKPIGLAAVTPDNKLVIKFKRDLYDT